MEHLKELYVELYENVHSEETKTKYKETKLSNFVAMRGKRYNDKKDDEIKFMVVGRAVNGWGESMDTSSAEAYADKAVELFENPNRFHDEWNMQFDNGEPYSEYEYENDNGEIIKKKYYLSKSAFWSTALGIYKELSGSEEKDCYEEIVWNNIYKVAPKDEGNPSTNLIYAQAETCVKILKEEIRLLKPTHILLVIDKSWISWTSRNKVMFDFMRAFDDYKCCASVVDGCGNGVVQCAFETNGCKVLVTCRPERIGRDEYKKAVVDAFGKCIKEVAL